MEDIIYYIGLGLIITFTLVRKASKTAAQRRTMQKGEPETSPIPEISSIETLFEELAKRANIEMAKPATSSVEMEGDSVPATHFEDNTPANRVEKSSPAPKKRAKSAQAKNPIPAAQAPKKGEIERNTEKNKQNEIAEEFDLREAVIYSEILKPKFDE